MKKLLISAAFVAAIVSSTSAQKYFTKDGSIRFFSATKVENIEAKNNKATCVVDPSTGDIEWSVLIKGFTFEKALMEEHFNENYMESTKFPKASFKGKVENMSGVTLSKDGVYKVKVNGDLTMHGVSKKVSTDATFTVAGGKISTDSKIFVNPNDYGINIPGPVKEKISDNIEVTINATLAALNK